MVDELVEQGGIRFGHRGRERDRVGHVEGLDITSASTKRRGLVRQLGTHRSGGEDTKGAYDGGMAGRWPVGSAAYLVWNISFDFDPGFRCVS